MKNKIKTLLFGLIATIMMVSSCKKDDSSSSSADDNELITTVTIKFTNASNSSDVVTATFQDLDGSGGNSPTIQSFKLKAGFTYSYAIVAIEDGSKSPTVNTLNEINEKDEEHRFYYASSKSDFKISDLNVDAKGKLFGTEAIIKTGLAGAGNLNVVLRHLPSNKDGATLSEIGGSTDIDITFPFTIE